MANKEESNEDDIDWALIAAEVTARLHYLKPSVALAVHIRVGTDLPFCGDTRLKEQLDK